MPETKNQPSLGVGPETLTFTRSDGRVTTIDLCSDILDANDTTGAVLWSVMMRLQGVMEFQEIMAQQNAEILRSQSLLLGAMEALVARASQPSEAPDYDKVIRKVWQQMGLPSNGMPGMPPGVSVTKPSAGNDS